ncbi:MAG: hypothetical protein MPEBLZ_01453 [Candidatus Methanoperedens nitroreducens]|uniref:Uncharacterized protein n=1 Tax=Candidatus Methanoperedens nitratireducens TaxID=1392998 RepID=A0A0P8E1B0_9EURY|nr:MAG: hypothetical protein MPEBLZ_01453 [Candidatus Methanoperedens sp. BLZ1]
MYHYIISSGMIEPLVTLYGKEKKGGIWKTKNLSISSEESRLELIKILKSYRQIVFDYMEGVVNIKDFNDTDNDNGGWFCKIMNETDLKRTDRLSDAVETKDILDFLNTNKFENVFFIIEINLNQSGDQKIILLKSISQTYYVKKNRYSINFWDNKQRIKFLNNKEYLLLDDNFDITAFVDNSCLFSWNKIYGNDNSRLIEFLKQYFGLDWIGTAKIEKIDSDKTIKVYTENNFLTISLNDKKTKVSLKIDDGRTNEFNARTEYGDLKIYPHSFFFITNSKKFEDLYEYLDSYKNAYNDLKKDMDFIDWSNAKATAAVQRNCYSIVNFLRLKECVSKLKTELTSANDNPIKRALKTKKIAYNVENGKIKINPEGPLQLKYLLKIIKDGTAKTCLLDREGISSDFEELT